MADRKCPSCGEMVPSYSLSCPRCFRDIPRDTVPEKGPEPVEKATGGKNRKIIMILALVPGLIGILGLGQIYMDYRDSKGWIFLAAGAVLFIGLILLINMVFGGNWFLSAVGVVMAIIVGLIYVSAYIAQAVDALFGSVFKIFRM